VVEVLLSLGDSLSEGSGGRRAGRRTVWLGAPAGRRGDPAVVLTDLSRRGAEVREVLTEQLGRLTGPRPRLITVSVGLNDACGAFAPRTADRLLTVLRERVAAADAALLVCTPPDVARLLRPPIHPGQPPRLPDHPNLGTSPAPR
jgi:lysophospholipase L1-like esterase